MRNDSGVVTDSMVNGVIQVKSCPGVSSDPGVVTDSVVEG